MKMFSETEPARLAQRFTRGPLKRMGGLVSLPPANGLGLLVPLSPRERIADCAELNLLHAAGNTRTKSDSLAWRFKATFGSVTRHGRELRARTRQCLPYSTRHASDSFTHTNQPHS